jgi:aspartyl-tRNA(Asn)/glutamyl-tRNA(Gln) amidotransferase subunit A
MTRYSHSIRTIREMAQSDHRSIIPILREYSDRIHQKNPSIQAFLHVSPMDISFPERDTSILPSLFGVPIAIKDNIWVKGIPCTAASRLLASFLPPDDATVVQRLKKAGTVISGKTNMDEFAMGSSTENSAFFATRNPHHTDFVPGGSSGGSTAAVAADMSLCALGSDTGGSIRQPSSFCGVVGIRPTYGLVSRSGLIGFAPSLDQIGPIAQSVEDAFQVLSVIAGHDPADDTTLPIEWKDLTATSPSTIAILEEIESLDMEGSVRDAYNQCKQFLSKQYKMITCSIPSFRYALTAYHIIADAEGSSNLSRMNTPSFTNQQYADSYHDAVTDTRTENLGEEVKRRILLGTFTLSSRYKEGYYQHAFFAREHIKQEFFTIFSQADAILTPSTITTAFPFKARVDPLKMYYSDICTIPSALAGLPAISLPVGYDQRGLPIGMQLIGNKLSELTLRSIALFLESTFHA